jgi:hypothetical protein
MPELDLDPPGSGKTDGPGPFYLDKPSTADVLSCSGAIARDGMRPTETDAQHLRIAPFTWRGALLGVVGSALVSGFFVA